MMLPTVKVITPHFSKNDYLRESLLNFFPSSEFNDLGRKMTREELKKFLQNADAFIVSTDIIDKDILDACKNLKLISKFGVGLDNLDLEECKKRGIKVGWTEGTNKLSVAECALGAMIILMHHIHITSHGLKQYGMWQRDGGNELSGKKIGIIGVGNIGKELVRILQPFKCEIYVNDIRNDETQKKFYKEYNCVETTKEKIFKEAAIISLHVPLTPETKYLINEKTLSMMNPTSYLINFARGGILDTESLKQALIQESIAGAALDVYEDEPIQDKSFLQLPNLLCTPHISGVSYESEISKGKAAIEHLKDYFLNI